MALFDHKTGVSVTVLQTDLRLYRLFKEKLVYFKKRYKTILKNVKKGYCEHTCHPNKYIAVLSVKKYFKTVFKIVSTVLSPEKVKSSFLPSTEQQWRTMIWTMNGDLF